MLQHQLFLQTEARQRMIHQGVVAAAKSGSYESLDVAVAYATLGGCTALTETLAGCVDNWAAYRKRWVVSFDWGITEPDAVLHLASLPNSQVWIPRAEQVLDSNLRPTRCFHPKYYVFRKDDARLGLFSTSANLTLSGLYLNEEQGTLSVWNGDPDESLAEWIRELAFFEDQLEEYEAASDELVSRYADIRTKHPSNVEEDEGDAADAILTTAQVTELYKAAAFATARCFWVEVENVYENRGPGIPGNQIDLQRGSRVFFGFPAADVPKNHHFGEISISYEGATVRRAMRFGNNDMDKLNLPVPGEEGPTKYDDSTLLFCRTGPGVFELAVGSEEQAQGWRERSESQGTLFELQSGRRFGVFD